MKICVLGMGYIGLPMACLLARGGHNVIGVDINHRKIKNLQNGITDIHESEFLTIFNEFNKKIVFSDRPKEAEMFIIAVPTPAKNKTPDLTYVNAAIESIKPFLRKSDIIIIESTVPPGTCKQLQNDIGCIVAHCPERAFPGNLIKELTQNERIIGADRETAQKIIEVYSSFTQTQFHVTDATTAEIVKCAENAYRDINIAYANELANLCEQVGSNVWNVISLANKHPRVNIHMPGPGVGGHCIPIDPWFLNSVSESMMIQAARYVNDSRPHRILNIIKSAIQDIDNPTVCILGMAYKGNVNDTRESPGIELSKLLESEDINYTTHDPFTEKNEITGDCLVIVADHDEYKKMKPPEGGKVVIDTRNILDKVMWENAGYKFILLGNGEDTCENLQLQLAQDQK